ncbi:MAG TPA: ABC transporter permease [Chloroflexota bacterium]|nr:ABC transporter permease [Chloroflexota bacterium]
MKMLLMARFTFREAFHKKVILGVMLLSLAFLAVFALGNWLAFRDLVPAASRSGNNADFSRMISLQLTLLGMNAVSMIGAILALFLSVGTISSEVDAGTLYSILPKPLTRRDVLLGKWLGYASMLAVYVLALSLAVCGVVALFSGHWLPQALPASLPLVLQALLLLSVSIMGTSFLPTVANGVMVFAVYSVSLVSGFVEQIGSIIGNNDMVTAAIAISLLAPSDAMSKLSASMLQDGASYLERIGPFMVNYQPSIWMVVYAVVYSAAMLAVAQAVFARKDL